MEIDAVTIQKTQKQLGKYVKKPALTDKLLNKPPFRFLHDIIKAVIKETGFMSNLFTPDELNYDNVKEKEAKIVFLTKLIDAIKTVSDTKLNVKPSKIVAGLEAAETNKLLQAIAKAIDKKADLSNYQTKKNNTKIKKNEQTINKDAKTIKKTRENEAKISSRDSNRNSKDSSRSNKKRDSSRARAPEKELKSNKEEKEQHLLKNNENENGKMDQKAKEENVSVIEKNETLEDEEPKLNHVNIEENSVIDISQNKSEDVTHLPVEEHNTFIRQPSANLIRPKSAKLKNFNVINAKNEPTELNTGSDLQINQQNRPKSSLRPPSVRPSSARPGAPRLRPESALRINDSVTMGTINVIVENFDNADDEETVVVQSTNENEDEFINITNDNNNKKILGELMNSQENKGQLVEQILEQIQEIDGEDRKVQQEIEWEQDTHTKDATAEEIAHVRALIQSLTKTANPLGKLLNYLHEDLDAMHNELQTWTNTRKQLTSEIEKQKKINLELSKPLVDNLKQIQNEIKKYEQEIVNVKANIIKNNLKIKELVSGK